MALKTTTGSKTADSMITVAEADAYLAASPYSSVLTAWTALSTANKEIRLKLAAKFMKNHYSWIGWPAYENQAMPFPRVKAVRTEDTGFRNPVWRYNTGSYETQYTDPETPDDIKRAQAYIAYGIIHRGLVDVTNPNNGPSGHLVAQSLSLFGDMSVSLGSQDPLYTDNSALEMAIRSEHFHINLLIEDWISQFNATPRAFGPTLLDEVA